MGKVSEIWGEGSVGLCNCRINVCDRKVEKLWDEWDAVRMKREWGIMECVRFWRCERVGELWGDGEMGLEMEKGWTLADGDRDWKKSLGGWAVGGRVREGLERLMWCFWGRALSPNEVRMGWERWVSLWGFAGKGLDKGAENGSLFSFLGY